MVITHENVCKYLENISVAEFSFLILVLCTYCFQKEAYPCCECAHSNQMKLVSKVIDIHVCRSKLI